ncbi:MAG: FAD-dependent oxidoreductase [Clostridiales bacterium]|nr:FAD-dependent oxidoreductase [Clostridiales bacterium]
MNSIWNLGLKKPTYKSLNKNLNVPVAIIGGGISGILTAYLLHQAGIEAIVIEANSIGSGTTGNTTAKITSQHDLYYHKLIKNIGKERASLYAKSNEEAIKSYERVINNEHISCHFKTLPNFVYSTASDNSLEQEVLAAKSLGIDCEYTDSLELPFPIKGAVSFKKQAQFNPLEFLYELSKNLTIYENSLVFETNQNRIKVRNEQNHIYEVKAEHIVIATHFPIIDFPGFYFVRMHQDNSYLIALENAPTLNGMYIDENPNGYTLRSYDNYLLFGGGGHRTGEAPKINFYDFLETSAINYFPNSKMVCKWSANDCMSHDSLPFIGKYSHLKSNYYVATGYKKWGMTSSMVAAKIISDSIMGKANEASSLFSPQRIIISGGVKPFIKDIKESVINLTVRKLKIPSTKVKDIKNGTAGIIHKKELLASELYLPIDEGAKRHGLYKGEDGNIYLVYAVCSHLGCALTWNQTDKTWDCPCHGSRFNFKGEVINSPACFPLVARCQEKEG